jgi:hypothetical protein
MAPEKNMRRPSVTDTQLLMMFELCLDAEDRCDERSREARARGDHEAATREARLEERYKNLRNRLFIAMKEDPASIALEQLTQQVMEAGRALEQEWAHLDKKKETPSSGEA